MWYFFSLSISIVCARSHLLSCPQNSSSYMTPVRSIINGCLIPNTSTSDFLFSPHAATCSFNSSSPPSFCTSFRNFDHASLPYLILTTILQRPVQLYDARKLTRRNP